MPDTNPSWRGWEARWYLWDGGFLALGASGPGAVPPHAHHAIQICFALEGELWVQSEDGERHSLRGAIVKSDTRHSFHGGGNVVAMLFIDPESRRGRWLGESLRAPVTAVAGARLEACIGELRSQWEEPPDARGTSERVARVVGTLCEGPVPLRPLDSRIVRGLEVIRGMDATRVSLEAVARAVFLSPSRFAHLFRDEVGVAFRRYVLWRRLTRAMLAVGHGSTLTAAAHASGFADSAHLTRTCYQMFGTAPSALMKAGEFYEIPPPYELVPEGAGHGAGDPPSRA